MSVLGDRVDHEIMILNREPEREQELSLSLVILDMAQ